MVNHKTNRYISPTGDKIRHTPYVRKDPAETITQGGNHWVPLPGELEKSHNCHCCQKPTKTTEHWCQTPDCRRMQAFLLSTNTRFASVYVDGQSLEWLRRAAFLMKTGNLVTRPDIIGSLLVKEAQKYVGQGIPPVAKIPEPKLPEFKPLTITSLPETEPPQKVEKVKREKKPKLPKPSKSPKIPKEPKVKKAKYIEVTCVDVVKSKPPPPKVVPLYVPKPSPVVKVERPRPSQPRITPCIYCGEQRPYTTVTGHRLKYCVLCGKHRYNEANPTAKLDLNGFVAHTEHIFSKRIVNGMYMGGCPRCGREVSIPKDSTTALWMCVPCIKSLCTTMTTARSTLEIRRQRPSSMRRKSRFNKTHRVVNNRSPRKSV